MIDLKIVRQNPELVKDSIQKRNLSMDLDEFLALDAKKIALGIEVDNLRATKNTVSKEIPHMSNEDRPAKIAEMKALGEQLSQLEADQKNLDIDWKNMYYQLPNFLDETASI